MIAERQSADLGLGTPKTGRLDLSAAGASVSLSESQALGVRTNLASPSPTPSARNPAASRSHSSPGRPRAPPCPSPPNRRTATSCGPSGPQSGRSARLSSTSRPGRPAAAGRGPSRSVPTPRRARRTSPRHAGRTVTGVQSASPARRDGDAVGRQSGLGAVTVGPVSRPATACRSPWVFATAPARP